MTKVVVKELVWDEHNLEHIKKHNVSQEEATQACKEAILHARGHSGRYIVTGRVGGRMISVIVRRVGTGKYRVTTARDAARKERRRVYEKEKK